MKTLVTPILFFLFTAVICGQSLGVPALRTPLSGPTDLVVAPNGDVYVIESDNYRVRKIDARTRRIVTVAGNGKEEYAGDGGIATVAALDYPTAVDLDALGNLYIADISGRVRKVDAVTQVITTTAGDGHMGEGGTGDGGLALAASFRRINDLSFDANGDLYVVDDMDHRVRKIEIATQKISTVMGTAWMSTAGKPAVGDVLGDNRSARNAALYFPQGIAFDFGGNIYIADYQNHRIRRVDKSTGIIGTVAGNGIPSSKGDRGLAVKASVRYPQSVVVDKNGNIFFSESSGIRRIDSISGRIRTVSRHCGNLALNGTNLYVSRFGQNYIFRIDLRTNRSSVFAGNGLPKRHDIIL